MGFLRARSLLGPLGWVVHVPVHPLNVQSQVVTQGWCSYKCRSAPGPSSYTGRVLRGWGLNKINKRAAVFENSRIYEIIQLLSAARPDLALPSSQIVTQLHVSVPFLFPALLFQHKGDLGERCCVLGRRDEVDVMRFICVTDITWEQHSQSWVLRLFSAAGQTKLASHTREACAVGRERRRSRRAVQLGLAHCCCWRTWAFCWRSISVWCGSSLPLMAAASLAPQGSGTDTSSLIAWHSAAKAPAKLPVPRASPLLCTWCWFFCILPILCR